MMWMILQRFIGIPGLKMMAGTARKSIEPNIGKEDRMIRFMIGAVALVGLMFIKKGFLVRYLLGLAALAGLATAYMKFSPVYALIGEDTTKKGKRK